MTHNSIVRSALFGLNAMHLPLCPVAVRELLSIGDIKALLKDWLNTVCSCGCCVVLFSILLLTFHSCSFVAVCV